VCLNEERTADAVMPDNSIIWLAADHNGTRELFESAEEYEAWAHPLQPRHPDGRKLETGMLGLNAGVISSAAAPFGDVKQSGLGREGGLEGIEGHLYTQYIGIADPYAG
jgi:hypothetical protein